jgi:hypothetical protein
MPIRKLVKSFDQAYFDNLEGCKCSLDTMPQCGYKGCWSNSR